MNTVIQLDPTFPRGKPTTARRLQALTEATLEAIGDAVITVDINGNIDYVNSEAEKLLLKNREDLYGRPFAAVVQIFNEHNHEQTDRLMAHCFCETPDYDSSRQLLLRRSDGSSIPIEDFAAPMRLTNGRTVGAVMVFKDVSERRQAQQSLNHINRTLHELLEFAPDAILIANPHGKILLTNNRAEEMFGYSKQQLAERTLQTLIAGAPSTYHLGGGTMQERRCRRADGSEFPGEVNLGRLNTAQGIRLMAVIRDITQRKYYEQQLSYQARYDGLTGLLNRNAIIADLQQALLRAQASASVLALMHIDLDHFNTVNNTFGHAVGDRLLKIIAERLQTLCRDSDTVAFLGGDHFVFLVQSGTDKEALDKMACAILDTSAESCDIDDHRIYLGCSIGIALYPHDGNDAQEIMRNADTAMYRAKESGRNTHVYFTRDMHRRQLEHMELSTGLREALVRGQFELYYQPKLDLNSMTVNSMEALIRWQHPDHGLIPPTQFIPVAEDCGLMVEIGAWVIDEACRQLAQWRSAGLEDIRVAVNLSAAQCHKDDIFTRITDTLSHYELPAKCLELEITESMVLHNPKQALATFRALRDQGIHIAIDDFGTGYSSFSYLKQFPSQCLKIDKSFIDDLTEAAGNEEIVRAIIAVAHCLNMRVIAEGVETVEQLIILQERGCDELQGYFFSRPIPGGQVLNRPWEKQYLPEKIALFDHAYWTRKIVKAMAENSHHDINVETASSHRRCLFGRWYNTWGKEDYGHIIDFAEINTIHIECHQLAAEMLRLKQAGEAEKARGMIPELIYIQQQLQKKLDIIHKEAVLKVQTQAG